MYVLIRETLIYVKMKKDRLYLFKIKKKNGFMKQISDQSRRSFYDIFSLFSSIRPK